MDYNKTSYKTLVSNKVTADTKLQIAINAPQYSQTRHYYLNMP